MALSRPALVEREWPRIEAVAAAPRLGRTSEDAREPRNTTEHRRRSSVGLSVSYSSDA